MHIFYAYHIKCYEVMSFEFFPSICMTVRKSTAVIKAVSLGCPLHFLPDKLYLASFKSVIKEQNFLYFSYLKYFNFAGKT